MKAPGFWFNPPGGPGWQAVMLAPIAMIYRLISRHRARSVVPARVGVPVICVGNLTAGGAGKTPLVGALVRRLQAAGHVPHVLSRGYGGRIRGPHRVDCEKDTFRDVGDEPLMLAAIAPVWVSRDRVAGARAAEKAGAGIILMDDGFQNPGLVKDLHILVVDAGQGFGNERMIPAGPLREPVDEGLARADLILLIGGSTVREKAIASYPCLTDADLIEAEVKVVETGLALRDEPVLAFAGIGRPEKFFETLDGLGARRVGSVSFADHYAYPDAVLKRLVRHARELGAMLVTTEKDAVRLPEAFRREVLVVQVMLEPFDWSALDAALEKLGISMT